MPRILTFAEGASPQKVTGLTGPSENEGPWNETGRTDFIVDPDLSAVVGTAQRYWKVESGLVVPFTAGEIAAQDSVEAAAADNKVRFGAKDRIAGQNGQGLILRALAEIIRREINILRSQHGLADRTLAQLRSAINRAIDDGDVDA